MIHLAAKPGESTDAIAQAICTAAARAIERQGRFVWVLTGGSTPKALYELLATPQWRGRMDWSRVEFFWGDERVVAGDHPDSNFRMAHEALLKPLSIRAQRIHRLRGEHPDLDQAAIDYEREINTILGARADGTAVPFDLVLLGLGEDGHTASLFPYTAALEVRDRAVVVNEVPQLNARRLTLTAARLNCAESIFFLVHGANKAAAVAAVLQGPRDPRRYPAQLIGAADWFVDEAAAAGLSG